MRDIVATGKKTCYQIVEVVHILKNNIKQKLLGDLEMLNQKEICMECRMWVNDETINPYFLDCSNRNCIKYKTEMNIFNMELKSEIDILLKLKPERI